MLQTNWIVITGGPSSGKSTLIEYLRSQGYQVVPESARVLIDEETAKGKTLQEIRADEDKFQKRIIQIQVEMEKRASVEQLTFFDRGIPDSIVYYNIHGGNSAAALKESQKRRYRGVFLCEQVPFKKDYARTENQKIAHKISKLLYETYTNLGYEVIKVPLMSVEDRASLILKELSRDPRESGGS